ncbi:MAG: YrdB family protein [Anaerolineales bacterium]|nr:YrdB family protein [Anaerolineales bacterium]
MAILQAVNMGLRFVLELCLLAALGYWGFQLDLGWPLRIAATIGAPLLTAVIWGLLIAPKASHRLTDPWRFVMEIVLFAVGAGALYLAGRPSAGAALFVIFLINRLLMILWSR